MAARQGILEGYKVQAQKRAGSGVGCINLLFCSMKWLKSFETRLTTLARALLALVIDLRWSNATLTVILNETDDVQKRRLLETWIKHRFADLERITITVSLLALTNTCKLIH